jgi:fatty acid desaturase
MWPLAPRPRPCGRPAGSDYAQLSRRVKQAGMMRRGPPTTTPRRSRSPWRYSLRAASVSACSGAPGTSCLIAAFLAIAFTQIAFLGHDAGHRQIFTTRKANGALGFLHGNLLVGLSFGWWLDKHTARHHAHPRTEGSDTHIGDGVLAFTTAQARNGNTVLGRMLTRGQAWLFFPMLLPEGLNLHVAYVRALLDGTQTPAPPADRRRTARRARRPLPDRPVPRHAASQDTSRGPRRTS